MSASTRLFAPVSASSSTSSSTSSPSSPRSEQLNELKLFYLDRELMRLWAIENDQSYEHAELSDKQIAMLKLFTHEELSKASTEAFIQAQQKWAADSSNRRRMR
jgi:hypothetical protein